MRERTAFLRWAAAATLLAAPIRADAQALAVPHTATNVPLATLASEARFTLDLGSLPGRPRLVADVVPDPAHPDMEYEVRITSCTVFSPPGVCSQPGNDTVSGQGPRTAYYDVFLCELATAYPGETCDVAIRPLSFGSGGQPASVDVTIRAETRPPHAITTTFVNTTSYSSLFVAYRDTTIYQASPSSSNGAGQSLWAAIGNGTDAKHALIDFDFESSFPGNRVLRSAGIHLDVVSGTPGSTVALYAIPEGSVDWIEGNRDASGDESIPPTPPDFRAQLTHYASWTHRNWNNLSLLLVPWATPGGDRGPSPLATATYTSGSSLVLSSPELRDHIATRIAGSAASDGFLLVPIAGALRFSSRDQGVPAMKPRLELDYFEPLVPVGVPVGTLHFTNEAQNFRFIPDLDDDYVYSTEIGGRCENRMPNVPTGQHEIEYTYEGEPGHTGYDCCVWQIGSTSGVTGVGQWVLSLNQTNAPPDTDLDGVQDPCDNCPSVPNGPFLGTCLFGARTGMICRSNQDCLNGPCSLAQDDADRIGPGSACVPEPGIGAMLACGTGALALRRSRAAARTADARSQPAR